MTRRTLAALLVVCGLLAVSGLLALSPAAGAAAEKTYTAQGMLRFDPVWNPLGASVPGAGSTLIPPEYFKMYVNSELPAIQNSRLLGNVLDKLNEKGEQKTYAGVGAAQRLTRDLKVEYLPDSFNVSVSLAGPNAKEVQAIVREVLIQYTESLSDQRHEAEESIQLALKNERLTLTTQVAKLAENLQRFRTEASVIATDAGNNEQVARLMVLSRQLTETQIALAEAATAWNLFEKLRKEAESGKDLTPALMAFPEIMDAMRRDPTLLSMTAEIYRMEKELAELSQRLDVNEAKTKIKASLAAAQTSLKDKQAEVLGQLYQQQAAVLKSRYDRLREAEADLLARQAEARAAAIGAARTLYEYRQRENEFLRVQALLNTVTDNLERSYIDAALTRPTVRVAVWPNQPLEPDAPKPAKP